jgi:outer membrane protease
LDRGRGVEYALTPAWSVFAEYDYLGLRSANIQNLGSTTVSPIAVITSVTPPGSSSVAQNIQEFKLGLNYKLGADPWTPAADLSPARLYPVVAVQWAPGFELETGVRYMYSWGQFHKDLGQAAGSSSPTISSISRLTYDNLQTNSAELFLRFETPWNFFVKGFIGGGWTNSSGHMNDEDFGIPFGPAYIPYSNTISGTVGGNIGYGVFDAGYDFFRGSTYKAGAFVGYTQFHQLMNAYGCGQIANPLSDCNPPFPTSVLTITENDTWIALRVGMSVEAMLTDRIKFAGDIAWLPHVSFNGLDTHWLREVIFPESGPGGQGVQLEGVLSYYVTPDFSVGVGGRYWAAWTTNGSDQNATQDTIPTNFRGSFQQAGAFIQASYVFRPWGS